jgi:hypothetical protein
MCVGEPWAIAYTFRARSRPHVFPSGLEDDDLHGSQYGAGLFSNEIPLICRPETLVGGTYVGGRKGERGAA